MKKEGKKLNWQIEIEDTLKSITNDELLSSTIHLSGGDDYDGCFTNRGKYEFDAYRKELEKRLTEIRFLTPSPTI